MIRRPDPIVVAISARTLAHIAICVAFAALALSLLALALAVQPPLKTETPPARLTGMLAGYGCRGYDSPIYRAEEDQFPRCRDIHRASILDEDQ